MPLGSLIRSAQQTFPDAQSSGPSHVIVPNAHVDVEHDPLCCGP